MTGLPDDADDPDLPEKADDPDLPDDAGFPEYVDVDYERGHEAVADDPSLETLFELAGDVVSTALAAYRDPAVLWTGGKDSTLLVAIVRAVAEEEGHDLPTAVFLDHYRHFPETHAFVERWADRWGLDLLVARNEAFDGFEPGTEVPVSALDPATRRELRERLDHDEDTVVFSPDTLAGNHLLKTVPLNDVIRDRGFDGVLSGIRWDEQAARADETFFSPRHDPDISPPHDRVHPILAFDERAVWEGLWRAVVPEAVAGFPAGHVPASADDLPAGVDRGDLPIHPLYFEGYRSLGTVEGSAPSASRPAWVQELETTAEREGRAQDKEGIMERLRDLGYM